jgi:hypothetical protein
MSIDAGGLGRQVLSIDRAAVTLMRSCNHNWVYIAEHLGVSTRTLSAAGVLIQ